MDERLVRVIPNGILRARLVQYAAMKNIPALLATLLCLGAAAASPDTVLLEELTSPEVVARVAGGTRTILIPIGGTEQNGEVMVLGKHNVRARVLAEEIARRLDKTLVAPVIAYVPEGSIDPPTGHMRGAGTISIPAGAFEQTLEGAARSLLRHGFTAVVLLGDHGGYHGSLRRVAERINRELKRTAILVPKEYYRELEHAGKADAQLSLAVDPKLVRNPAGTSVEAGRAAREDIVETTVRSVRQALAR
jgi:creatinine amidohydrolase/Fe(II)-dependent formamide hydrolase-like protein